MKLSISSDTADAFKKEIDSKKSIMKSNENPITHIQPLVTIYN